MKNAYRKIETPNVHLQRKKEISLKHPEVKKLMGSDWTTVFWIIFLVAAQLSLAYFFSTQSFLITLMGSYVVGAFLAHATFVMIHECAHNLVFKRTSSNKLAGILCDTSAFFPSSLTFRKYHMIHHRHLNEYDLDPDMAGIEEARKVGDSTVKKFLWIFFFGLSQGLRPLRFKKRPGERPDKWIIANMLYVLVVNIVIFYFLGYMAIFYLALSSFFGVGLHPLGGRWIQEHYILDKEQETFSYYGILNKVSFNVGYHNEHHDFMNVSWKNLPKLKKLASEFYDGLYAYKSWTNVLYQFIFNPSNSVFDRVSRVKEK